MKNKKTTEFYTIADEDVFNMMFSGFSKKKIEPTLCGKIKFNNGNIEDIYWHEDDGLTISNYTQKFKDEEDFVDFVKETNAEIITLDDDE